MTVKDAMELRLASRTRPYSPLVFLGYACIYLSYTQCTLQILDLFLRNIRTAHSLDPFYCLYLVYPHGSDRLLINTQDTKYYLQMFFYVVIEFVCIDTIFRDAGKSAIPRTTYMPALKLKART